MLSHEDDELLTGAGPGALMSRYWLPVLYSHELEADGAPQRIELPSDA